MVDESGPGVGDDPMANAQALMGMADVLRPGAIRAAATLGLADHIAAGTTTVEDLARVTDTHAATLAKLLRFLAAHGVFRRDGDGYALTPLSEPLKKDAPISLRQMLDSDGMLGHGDLGMINIVHTVRTGEACHASVFGRGFWDSVNDDETFADTLDDLAPRQLVFDQQLIVDEYDWSGVQHVADVGGNTGTLLIELLRKNPHLRGTLVDRKNMAELGARRIEAAGLSDRCEAVVGDFFKELPAGPDVYMLSAILADWKDEQAIEILRRCAEAAGAQGKVLVSDANMHPVGEANPDDPRATGADLFIAGMMPVPVRTEDELLDLARAAGLELTWRGPATALRSLLEFSPKSA